MQTVSICLYTYCGIRGGSLKIFESSLMGRKQSVVINNVKSNESSASQGVKQGSNPGTILF